MFNCGGRALNGLGGPQAYRNQSNSECRMFESVAVRRAGISLYVERETAQTIV
jgi:hypothetical protein